MPVQRTSFDHFVSASQHGPRKSEAEGLGGFEVCDELKSGGRFKRQIGRPRPAPDSSDEIGGAFANLGRCSTANTWWNSPMPTVYRQSSKSPRLFVRAV